MSSDTLPDLIGPYRVTGRLGRGGMGEVLRGYDDRLDRPVALKRVRAAGRDPAKARQRFQREAKIVARLSHPAIVQIYDWEEAEGNDWLVMELIDGRSLEAVLADGPLPPGRAAAIAQQIAAGLAVAHEAGLVHRDLKPANVMVAAGSEGRDEIKILDFGLAKRVELEPPDDSQAATPSTLTEAGQVVGTTASMSPEQTLGWPVDHRSDLFSLGILLYEMLSGVSPFKAEGALHTLNRICSVRETPLRRLDARIPAELADLVGRLLEKEPARRPVDARAVIADLNRWTATLTIDAATGATEVPATEAPPTSVVGLEGRTGALVPPASPIPAGSADTTLIADRATQAPSSTGEDSPTAEEGGTTTEEGGTTTKEGGTYEVRRLSGRPIRLAAIGALAVALLSLLARRDPPTDVKPNPAAVAAVTRGTAEGTPLDSHELYLRGMDYLQRYDRKGNIDLAIADFQRALALEEGSAPALAGLAWAYWLDFYVGSFDPVRLQQAEAAAQQAVKHGEYLAVARVSLGMVYFEQGRAEEAKAELEQALQLEPLNGDAQFALSRLYDSQGDFTRAERHIRRAIEAQPDRWYPPSWLGTLYFKAARYDEAESAFRRSLELAQDNFLSLRNLGATYYMQGKLAAAASKFQQALQIRQDHSLYTNLGTIYFAQGLYPQAVSAFEKAVETGAGANAHLLWANLGDAYRWTPDNQQRAREAFLRAIQLLDPKLDATPEDLTLRTRRALYLAKRGDCEQARDRIDALKHASDNDAGAWYRLAVANEVCSQREAALVALERALQAGYAITDVKADPELLELRQDIRYHPLMQQQSEGARSSHSP